MDVTEIIEPSELLELEPEWRRLFDDRDDLSPFSSPDWLLPWREKFLREDLRTLAVRKAGALVGLAPFYIHHRSDGCRQLTLMGNGASDRLELLASPGASDEVAKTVFAHLARSQLWDSCDFRDLPSDSPLLITPLPGAVADRVEDEEPCLCVPLPSRPDKVWDLLPHRQRLDLRRRARRAAEAGALTYETADTESRGPILEELVRLHGARWEARGQTGMLSERAAREFHRDATTRLMKAGLLRLYAMRLDGHAIAAIYGLRRGSRAFAYLTAFNSKLAPISPGLLLLNFALQESVREGASEFDFLRGREPYKCLWGARERRQFRRQIQR